jgi:RimJ/RimL family protein N-acetyltransferase
MMVEPDFRLKSNRIGFRPLEESDLQNLVRLDTDPEVRAFFPDGVSTPELLREKIARSRASFLENGFGEFSMTDLQTNRFIGRAGFAALEDGEIEVGYLAYAPIEHLASLGVMRKAGMFYLKTEVAQGVCCKFYEYPLKAG